MIVTIVFQDDSLIPNNQVSHANIRLWNHVVNSLQKGNLTIIIKFLFNEHREKKDTALGLRKHFSLYR